MALITTTHGDMDESLLEKREGSTDTATESSEWVEYWLDGELVHRSVALTLKPLAPAVGEAGAL